MERSTVVAAIVVAAVLALPAAGQQPLDVGLEEEVEVRLVLVDFLALDRAERTVADLAAEQLTLLVDGRARQIESLDRDCPIGEVEDPRGGSDPGPANAIPTALPAQAQMVMPGKDHVPAVFDTHKALLVADFVFVLGVHTALLRRAGPGRLGTAH